mgnify:CR=1 FL=1
MKFTETASKEIRKIMERDGLNPKDMMDFWVDNNMPIIPMTEVVELSLIHISEPKRLGMKT